MGMSNQKPTVYKMNLSYDGRAYFGWQIQDQEITVQGTLNNALKKIFKSDVKTVGAGRTDTGVHALFQVVKVTVPFYIEENSLVKALNANLPQDIRVNSCILSSEEFRPTNDAIKKTYYYLFSNEEVTTPFQKDLLPNISYELDFEMMKKACSLFIGTHNFSDFKCVGTETKSDIRTIFECTLDGPHHDTFQELFPKYYKISISADGFLKQMVRLIVGAIWNVGMGKVTLTELEEALKTPKGKRFGPVAPSFGLYKAAVFYS